MDNQFNFKITLNNLFYIILAKTTTIQEFTKCNKTHISYK